MISNTTVTAPGQMTPRRRDGIPSRALHRYAVCVAVCTALLVFAGGLVTSTGAGLSVPDWPLSYGMIFPPMVGNVLYEHGHRMIATAVGLMTIVLAIWLQRREARPRVRRLGWLALAAVVLQGVLGGITVLLMLPPAVSIAHACLGQTFFCIVVAIALLTSPSWQAAPTPCPLAGNGTTRALAVASAAAVFLQLVLGALMRHTGAGLAIPDYPLAFGRLVPQFTTLGIAVHFAHRTFALVVAACIAATTIRIVRQQSAQPELWQPAILLAGLVVTQIALGAFTIWSAKAVVPTTLHVLGGALILATSLVLAMRSFHLLSVEGTRRNAVFSQAVTS